MPKIIKKLTDKLSISIEWPSEEERSCLGKVKYGHKETAEKAVLAMMNKGSKPLEAYPCKYCSGWHIGGVL